MHSNNIMEESKLIEMENKLKIKGIINHLKELGWDSYQRRYEEGLSQGSEEDIKTFKKRFKYVTHFAEFFSEKYNGMLRGDSKNSLREAVEKCLNRAQKYCACEQRKGHEYVPYKNKKDLKEYDNGLVMCKHCGFNGYTNIIKDTERQISTLENIVNIKQELIMNMSRSAKKNGLDFNILGDLLNRNETQEYLDFNKTIGEEIRKEIKEERKLNKSMIEILSALILEDERKNKIDEKFISNLYNGNKNVLVKYAIGMNEYNFELVISTQGKNGLKEILKSDNFIVNNEFDASKLNKLLKEKILKYKNLNTQINSEFCENIIYNSFLFKKSKQELENLPKRYRKILLLKK